MSGVELKEKYIFFSSIIEVAVAHVPCDCNRFVGSNSTWGNELFSINIFVSCSGNNERR